MSHNPYIGLRPYETADAERFRGRRVAVGELLTAIRRQTLVVLYAESGEGKSSLINAGLIPRIRAERFFPVHIRFTDDEYQLPHPSFDDIVTRRLEAAIEETNQQLPDADAHMQLTDTADVQLVDGAPTAAVATHGAPLMRHTWYTLRQMELTLFGITVTPLLIFDQMEEVFTRPRSIAWTDAFFAYLRALATDEPPQTLVDELRAAIGPSAPFPTLRREPRFRCLLSLRAEYMGELDYWGVQRHHINALTHLRYCLKPLTEDEANEVLALQPAFSGEQREQIKSAIATAQRDGLDDPSLPVVPAMLLSVVCTTASQDVDDNAAPIPLPVGDGAESNENLFTRIIADFYRRETNQLIPPDILHHIEDALVDENGRRVRIRTDARELREVDFDSRYKATLLERRLIKVTRINGAEYVELVHDALARVIMEQRTARQAREGQRSNILRWGAVGLVFAFSTWYWLHCLLEDKEGILFISPFIYTLGLHLLCGAWLTKERNDCWQYVLAFLPIGWGAFGSLAVDVFNEAEQFLIITVPPFIVLCCSVVRFFAGRRYPLRATLLELWHGRTADEHPFLDRLTFGWLALMGLMWTAFISRINDYDMIDALSPIAALWVSASVVRAAMPRRRMLSGAWAALLSTAVAGVCFDVWWRVGDVGPDLAAIYPHLPTWAITGVVLILVARYVRWYHEAYLSRWTYVPVVAALWLICCVGMSFLLCTQW